MVRVKIDSSNLLRSHIPSSVCQEVATMSIEPAVSFEYSYSGRDFERDKRDHVPLVLSEGKPKSWGDLKIGRPFLLCDYQYIAGPFRPCYKIALQAEGSKKVLEVYSCADLTTKLDRVIRADGELDFKHYVYAVRRTIDLPTAHKNLRHMSELIVYIKDEFEDKFSVVIN